MYGDSSRELSSWPAAPYSMLFRWAKGEAVEWVTRTVVTGRGLSIWDSPDSTHSTVNTAFRSVPPPLAVGSGHFAEWEGLSITTRNAMACNKPKSGLESETAGVR
jgi:hypothetical protein